MLSFRQALRRHRQERNLSQMALAHAAGISTRHLSCIESGRARSGRDVTYRLLRALGLEHAEVVELAHLAGHAAPAARYAGWAVTVDASLRALLAASLHPSCILDREGIVVGSNLAFDALLGLVAPPDDLWVRVCGTGPRSLRALSAHPHGLLPHLRNAEAVLAAFDARARGQAAVDVIERYTWNGLELAFRPLEVRFTDVPDGDRIESFVPVDERTAEILGKVMVGEPLR